MTDPNRSTHYRSIHYRACNLCDAMCGLAITVENETVLSIKGDKQDPVSRGFICPKATALADLHEDPNRLRRPVKRVGREWIEIAWDEAFALAASGLHAVRSRHGADAVAVYRGNPGAHNWGLLTHGNHFLRRLGTHNHFSPASADTLPHHLMCFWMYGHQFLQPIPDIDRSQYLLLLGYNPMVSNGSLMAMPDFRGRVKSLHARGGKIVVIDPRRTETAEIADEHHFIRPATDAALLLAMIGVIIRDGLVDIERYAPRLKNIEAIAALVAPFTPAAVAPTTGIEAQTIVRLAHEFAAAPAAACHGRMGLSTQQFGTLCQWAIQILNLLTSNLDRPGGTLLTHPAVAAVDAEDRPKGSFARRHSRVSGYPEFSGEYPVAAFAEEMLVPGSGQVRGLVTVAGNPVLSTPNGRQLDRALADLEFMVSVDIYCNETTRHAHLILPPTSALEHDQFDMMLYRFSVRNAVRYNAPVLPRAADALHDWEIFNGLAKAHAALLGEAVNDVPAPESLLDQWLHAGLYGALRGHPLALNLDKLKHAPHGLDLGPLRDGLFDRLCTHDRLIDCLPAAIAAEVERLQATLAKPAAREQLLLIGRRHLRSNNSWLHNSHRLVKGPRRNHLLMHPGDMRVRNIIAGAIVTVRSRVGAVRIEVQPTEDLMPGTVSLPHGWGHDREGVRLDVAAAHAGVSANDLTDERAYDGLSFTSVLNGVPVEVEI